MTRRVLIGLGELLDRLSIDLIKQVADPAHATGYGEEIAAITADLDRLPALRGTALSGRLVRLLAALAQINLHIWQAKDEMRAHADRFADAVTLAHRLNGIRNQLKVALQSELDGSGGSGLPTNTVREDFDGWVFSILDRPASMPASPPHGEARAVNFTLADLIDRITISQIKETLFSKERSAMFTRDLAEVAADMDTLLADKPVGMDGRLIRLIMLMAQCNLHVWTGKDRMDREPDSYVALLARAQDLNGLRNHARNRLMDAFGEMGAAARRSTFLDEEGEQWYSPIIRAS